MKRERTTAALDNDPLWYKDAIIYQAHVRAFYDSNGDGVGDFRGLTQKLDYVRDLGVTALWILPFYPSPLRDDGYDIADYTAVNPMYGRLADVRAFVREAHRRGLRVITELVCNHTSDQHPWFQRARRAKRGSVWRDFYVWSDTPERYREARVIFRDFESSNWTWDPVAGAYYWHRFYHHQPDLNFENPRVQSAIVRAMEFWLDLGVDGLRLDAIPYLYEAEGTNCENLPETHAFLRRLRAHIDTHYSGRMLLAEANQWPEDAVAYFGQGVGDECNMAFHFPLMPRMFMALRMEDHTPIVDILDQTPPIPETAQWAIFLRNHDELTLEMVTDEERDYMYRMYAHDPHMRINLGIRRRLAPLLGNNRRRIELMNGLLFSLPGTPTIYYGDEIGMGDNVYLGDRNGVRTPMQWNSDRNAGFSSANRQRLYAPVIVDPEYHYETVNVEAQQGNPHSLLWWMKRLIALRKVHPAFGRGTLEILRPTNRKVLAFVRADEQETLLVVANLSRFVQAVELDLSQWRDTVPVELFGGAAFPPVGPHPYFITLGPHSFYWFALTPARISVESFERSDSAQTIRLAAPWVDATDPAARPALERAMRGWLPSRPWFAGNDRRITTLSIVDCLPLGGVEALLVSVAFVDGDPDLYVVPIEFAADDDLPSRAIPSDAVIARIEFPGGAGVLYDAADDATYGLELLELIAHKRRVRGEQGALIGMPQRALRSLRGAGEAVEPRVVAAGQVNTLLIFGDRLALKALRRIEDGPHPEVEVGQALANLRFPHVAPLAGFIEYATGRDQTYTVGVLHGYIANTGDAWSYTLDELQSFWDRVLAASLVLEDRGASVPPALLLSMDAVPAAVWSLLGTYLSMAHTLGRRTAELHRALASISAPEFAPEPFSHHYRRAVYQAMRNTAAETWRLLRRYVVQDAARDRHLGDLIDLEARVYETLRAITTRRLDITRLRIHGDLHLGQVLFTGTDFVIIDFEGDLENPLSYRRIKRSPLRDVAGMLRSMERAAWHSVAAAEARGLDLAAAGVDAWFWVRFWSRWASAGFVNGYLAIADAASFVPGDPDDLNTLLRLFQLDMAVSELRDALNNRKDWAWVPAFGIRELLTLDG